MSEWRPDFAAPWLSRARSDLAIARAVLGVPEVALGDVCFHAQQAAEKALKALLVARRAVFPRTHVLEHLMDLLVSAGVAVPPRLGEAIRLTDYAVATRYPGFWEPITAPEAAAALETAEAVVAWVEQVLAEDGAGPA